MGGGRGPKLLGVMGGGARMGQHPQGAQRAPGRPSPGAGVRWVLGSNPSSLLTSPLTLYNVLGFWGFVYEVGVITAFGGLL